LGGRINVSNFTDRQGLPHDRYVVVGTSGSGKTTVSANLAAESGLEHIELDALHWLEDWTERPPKEFRTLVECETHDQ
jgi:adenylate kinase family enzyme